MQKFTSSTKKEELSKLTKEYIRLRNMSFVQVGFLIAALATALVKAMLPSILCLAAMLLFRLTIYRKFEKNYRQAITDTALICSVGTRMEQFELDEKGSRNFTREDVLSAQLLPVRDNSPNNIRHYQSIYGSAKGMEVSLSDTTIILPAQEGGKNNDVLLGVWMHFSLPKDTDRHFRIYSRDLLESSLRKEFMKSLPAFRRQETAAAGLQNNPFVYAEEKGTGTGPASDEAYTAPVPAGADSAEEYSLPASFSAALNRLTKKHAAVFAFSADGKTADFFLKDRILAPGYSVNTKPDERMTELDPLPEFRDVLDMVTSL